jgi:hypothetical protein
MLKMINSMGYDIRKIDFIEPDFDKLHVKIMKKVQQHTLTSKERLNELLRAIDYISKARIMGDIVECGVYRGGSMMACAIRLLEIGDVERTLHLFDTFEGMPKGDKIDVDIYGKSSSYYTGWACAGLDEVRTNMHSTKYPVDNIRYVKGKVEDTLPDATPDQIALLRLDTDWYSSTLHELNCLYDKIPTGGVLIIDDYGHFEGARQAVDEFFQTRGEAVFLSRIDYTGRLIIKR